jgi:branched-chain amino acid transport system substrate-binding protein
VFRNLLWATERVNARGGVRLADGLHELVIERYDSKGQNEEALSALRAAIDSGARIIMQGNSSATAAALLDAIDKHNSRDPSRRVLYLNYSAVDPALTNERCSFWHFRFDAHADMRMAALMEVIKDDKAVHSAYLIGQDYSFGQAVLREARRQLGMQRPDVRIVGDELHPVGRVKDFAPYAVKIKQSGAQAVITGNWGNDLMLLVKAAREAGYEGRFYTFYGNALGAPAALGDAGVGKVLAVADWLPNVPTREPGLLPVLPSALSQAAGRLCAYAHAAHDRGSGAEPRKSRQHGHRRRGPCHGHARVQLAGRSGSMGGTTSFSNRWWWPWKREAAQAWTSMWKARATASRCARDLCS